MANAKGWGARSVPVLAATALLTLSLGIGVGLLVARLGEPGQAHVVPSTVPVQPADAVEAHAGRLRDSEAMEESVGPWGRLRFAPIWLMPRSSSINADDCSEQMPAWVFPQARPADLARVLANAGIEGTLRQALAAVTTCDARGCEIRATVDLARQLGPRARVAIYGIQMLRQEPEWHDLTRVFRDGEMDHWFDEAEATEAERAAVRALAYPVGDDLVVSDVPVLCAAAKDAAERRRIVRLWSASRALLVKLRVQPGDDLGAVIDWWRPGTQIKDVGPLLESAARVEGGISVDVVHLLPPMVRRLLNTFPGDDDVGRHCWWTALNFGRREADDAFRDNAIVVRTVQNEWRAVRDGSFRLGDLVVFEDAAGEAWHVAVHIADGIVFTKNGGSRYQPWVLARQADVQVMYKSHPGLHPVTYRRIDTP